MRDKQIEEMATVLMAKCDSEVDCSKKADCDMCRAEHLYEKGYRKISDDHQRQCTCYALGCQMAEELKRERAREIFEEIENVLLDKASPLTVWCAINGQNYAKLKKKYTEGKK